MQVTQPEKIGLSSTRLNNIDKLINRYVTANKFAGAAALVARQGKIGHFACYGKMNLAADQEMQTDAIFRIHSMTKPITSVALMLLYEQGHFQLEDPVAKFIPEFKDMMVFASGDTEHYTTVKPQRQMIIADLLSHTSGLTYHFEDSSVVAALYRAAGIKGLYLPFELPELISKLAKLPLLFSPGTHWNYSLATDVCGYLVQVISGCKFEDFVRQNVLQPLRMIDTDFYVPKDKLKRFTAAYVPKHLFDTNIIRNLEFVANSPRINNLILVDDPGNSVFAKPPKLISGGGGLVSTINDYYNFTSMLINHGKFGDLQLLSPKTIELMTSNHLAGDLTAAATPGFSEIAPAGVGFGLGFATMQDSVRARILGSKGEYNWGGFASTMFFVDPQEELIGILLAQLYPSTAYPLRREYRVAVYQSIL